MGDPSVLFWLGAFVVIAFVDLVAIMNLWRSDKSLNTRPVSYTHLTLPTTPYV